MDENKRTHIKSLYDSSFPQDKPWNQWFFDNVYKDDEGLILYEENKPVSCLLLQAYDFLFHGRNVRLAYISGAATHYKSRGKGYMTMLMKEALRTGYERGDALACLIPANRRLFFFYDKFQFASVVFADIERYTAIHAFPITEGYTVADPDYASFNRLERLRDATVLHSEKDFENILEDIAHDGGVAVRINDSDGQPLAMVFGTANRDEIHFKEILGIDKNAVDMAMGTIKTRLGVELPAVAWLSPTESSTQLRPRGMMRIVNVEKVLSALADSHPEINQTVKVRDRIIEPNNGIFILEKGKCRKLAADAEQPEITLEADVDVLTKILFSGSRIGNVFGFPTSHPTMSLMLD